VQRSWSRYEAIEQLAKLTPSEAGETAVLGPEIDPATGRSLIPAEGRVLSVQRQSNQLVYKLSVDKPGVFVVADSFFPGWRAYVNERRVGISRANVNFKAVQVPAGRSVLRLQFSTRIFGDDNAID
jgi:hypothetical protein